MHTGVWGTEGIENTPAVFPGTFSFIHNLRRAKHWSSFLSPSQVFRAQEGSLLLSPHLSSCCALSGRVGSEKRWGLCVVLPPSETFWEMTGLTVPKLSTPMHALIDGLAKCLCWALSHTASTCLWICAWLFQSVKSDSFPVAQWESETYSSSHQ